jgi:pilus assembly protein CpaB
MRNKIILILALTFGLMAAFGTFKYLDNLKKTYRTSGNYARVAVAAQTIPARTPIQEQMLKSVEMPVEYITAGAVVDAKDAVGKLARGDIYPDEQILHNKLVAREDPDAGLAGKVTPGRRAVTVAVDPVSALAGMVVPGDRVDVIATFDTEGNPSQSLTSTIIHNVPVLAVDANIAAGSPESEEPATVTLQATPAQAQDLVLATERGSIRLTLRSPDDGQATPVPSSRINNLIR